MVNNKEYTNRLKNESSPYLLQHAHNPVDWYPWGDEAFERAKAEDKPVLVSIGYSACHWCHVMERESFASESIAALMNEHFVSVKVDMEERPDVDQIYMTFVQMTTGRGGWPMNVFLTPEKLPFFGGTYFPPSPRYGMPSWPQILMSIADAWRDRRDELMHSATEILGELRRAGMTEPAAGGLNEGLPDRAFESFVRTFDSKNGGFGGAPKFPAAMAMEFLLRYWKRTGNENALTMVRHTAEKMARGGIYDQIGGGFHRYSVDAVWLVPHFEKMLYDNAQLVRVYLHLYQITKEVLFKRVATEILEYVLREMTGPEGGFYSTQDADSEGEEGKFFVWTPKEVEELLGEEDARVFGFYYDISEDGNFEGKNVLNVKNSSQDVCEALGVDEPKLNNIIDRGKRVLFEAREKRIKPFRDEKVIVAWNGLMMAAFAEAGAVLNETRYVEAARRNADFLLEDVRDGDRIFRTWKDGTAKLNGYIEDYANLCDGLLELYQVTGEQKYLDESIGIAEQMIVQFWDEESGGFYFTSNDHETLIVRNKDLFDNATPSGNSVAADVFIRLSKLTGDERFERFGATVLRIVSSQATRHPQGFGRTLSTLEFYLGPVKEIVIVAKQGSELEREVWADYRPFKVVAKMDPDSEPDVESAMLKGKGLVNGKEAVYVCEAFVCDKPVTTVGDLRKKI
jgi:uncharacterized protein